MKNLALLLLLSVSAFAQNGRWDLQATTVQAQGGNLLPVYAIPGAEVSFLSCSSGLVTSCTTPAMTYNGAGAACPSDSQVNPQGSLSCTNTADTAGNFGAFFANGTYAYTLTANGSSYGPFLFSVGSGSSSGVTLQTNGTNNGSQSLLNLVAGTNVTLSNTGGATTINASGGGGGGCTTDCMVTDPAVGVSQFAAQHPATTFGATADDSVANNVTASTEVLTDGTGDANALMQTTGPNSASATFSALSTQSATSATVAVANGNIGLSTSNGSIGITGSGATSNSYQMNLGTATDGILSSAITSFSLDWNNGTVASGFFLNASGHNLFDTNGQFIFTKGSSPGGSTSVLMDFGGISAGHTYTAPNVTGELGIIAGATTAGDCPEFDSTGKWLVDSGAACGGGGGAGTVTSVATTAPLGGGPITGTGTITCATCVVATSPGIGIAHFAGSTQTVTSSAVSLTTDVTGALPNSNLANASTTVNGVTCTLGSTCTTGIANTTTTVGTTAVGANACSASSTTVTMTGLATTSTVNFTPNSDVSGVTGWGSTGGLTIDAWPSATNTLSYKVCNQTSSSITPSASVTFNISAR